MRTRHRGLVGARSSVAWGIALAGLGLQSVASAEDFQVGDVKLKMNGALTLGTAIRTTGRDSNLVPSGNGAAIGVTGVAAGGRNQDDGNLNFGPGKPVSTVLKAVLGVDASYRDIGLVVRGKAWRDFTLGEMAVPFGNLPSRYAAGQPLSDTGLVNAAQFSGISLLDAFVYGKVKLGAMQAEGRLGNQVIPWGSPTAIAGGLFTTINAIDLNALYRPGVLPEEVVVRMPAAYGRLDVTQSLSLEGFYQIANTHNESVGCGSFYSPIDYVAPGCNFVMVGSNAVSDPTSLATGSVIGRAPIPRYDNPQFGFGGTYKVDSIGTKFGVYYAHVNSRAASTGAQASSRIGAPFIPGNADGLNVKYLTSYAPNIDMLGANFATKMNATSVYGEFTYKIGAPVQLNSIDILNAFASSVAPTPLRAAALATPPGSVFLGYDRYDLGQFQLGATQTFPDVLGAKALVIGGEAALKQVYGLQDVNARRYGRSDVYGQGPVAGVCAVGASAHQCSTNGYVTPDAWGYRLKASLTYDNVGMPGLQLTPSIGLAHDVQGWSADGVFSQGRMVMNLGLYAEYKTSFFADVQWSPTLVKGSYDNLWDRQFVSLSAGLRF